MRICRYRPRVHCVILAALIALASRSATAVADDQPQVLATIDGEPITSADLELFAASRGLTDPVRGPLREQLLNQLIDRRLIRRFLERRKVAADPDQVAARLDLTRKVIAASGEDFATVLKRLGYTVETFRDEVALPLAWQAHINATVTDSQIRDYFKAHRAELDGTRVSARQIVLFIDNDHSRQEAERKLQQIRKDLLAGKVSFDDAARKHSDSPSGQTGGNLGTFPRYGAIADPVARVAFSLRPGGISEPFQTARGVHLLEVTDRTPGDFSLEDVRPQVLKQLSRQIWNQQVDRERQQVDIVITD
ncbi:peptidylprolyl isomerase [Maioricimonas sp. JC845]|uniref:foldase protein PrsA n=1 Tax=Maioricimonas sp. JC845 TaxID=3232138 RepID=UPI00345A2E8D